MPDAQLPDPAKKMRVGFLHRFDARDKRSWSGILYSMAKALEPYVGEIVYLGPDNSFTTKFIIDNTARLNRVWTKLTGKALFTDHNRVLSKRLARVFERRIAQFPCDIIYAPVASVEIAYLKTDIPIVYLSDITWAQIVDYYPAFSSLSATGKAEAERTESAAIANASASIFPSQWAVDGACNHYGSPREFTFNVPMGANLEEPPSRAEALDRSLDGPLNLLLVGVDWERKGGEIAFECLTSLLDRGVDARLTICGCVPPPSFKHPKMTVIPFLDKRFPEQRLELSRLFHDAHFMLFPTRADALGVVTCEASAHGLPSLVTDTGGTGGALRDGVNGFLMPFEARGEAYADKILSLIAEPARYRELVVTSRDEYDRYLNWDSWGRSVAEVMEQVLHPALSPEMAGRT
jgi:glycosyltransferase involved in cell wall biosynthesis